MSAFINSLNSDTFHLLIVAPTKHGKTRFLKNIVRKLKFNEIYVISNRFKNDYSKYPYKTNQLDIDFLESLRRDEHRKKIIIFDDIVHLGLDVGNRARWMAQYMVDCRHSNISLIVSVQFGTAISKKCRQNFSHVAIGQWNTQTEELYKMLIGEKPNLSPLRKGLFMCVDNTGYHRMLKLSR